VTERPAFYPKPRRYFAQLTPERPIFQGDIFRGAFGAWWRHPVAARAALAGKPIPDDPAFPTLGDLTANVLVRGQGYAMLLPQPCEYADGEKGATHPFRLVAPLLPLDRHSNVDHALVRAGEVGHTVWVPNWKLGSPQDYFVDLRLAASIDSTFVRPRTRVAALSGVAWLSLADRLSRYFVGVPLDAIAFSLRQGHLHPDAAPATAATT
jgi:hypothetical protein